MTLFRKLWLLIRRDRFRSELDEEMAFHREQAERDFVAAGLSPQAARLAAMRQFGNTERFKERSHEVIGFRFETVVQDLRYGARMLYRNAGFTVAAVVALAIGIGVNTAAFTASKAFFDRTLDARNPGTMVNLALIRHLNAHAGATDPNFSYPDYEAYRDRVHSFSGLIAASIPQNLTLSGATGVVSQRKSLAGTLVGRFGLLPTGQSRAETATAFIVSENYFSVIGVPAWRGRTFDAISPAEFATSPAVLISENYWRKRFGGDITMLGKSLRLNGASVTIVGITPHDFIGTSIVVPDFWLPLSEEPLVHPADNWLHSRETWCCRLYGRLAPGVGVDQAQTEMSLLADRVRTLHDPNSDLNKAVTAYLWPGSPFPYPFTQFPGLKYTILLIMAAVAMVLVIACANVASLQLSRAASRQNELNMRLSLGASRLRLVRQLLTESALLGLLAGGVALMCSWAMLKVLANMIGNAFPAEYGTFIFHVTPDLAIFAYTLSISLAAGILFGLAPALESSRTALSSALKANAATSPVRSRRLRDFLIAAQVAVSLAFMIVGSMLIRSSIQNLKVETGYEIKHVVALNLQFPEGEKYTADGRNALAAELRSRLAALPGVAAVTAARPPLGGAQYAAISLNGEQPSAQNTRVHPAYSYIQANYFQTLGMPLVLGHNFTPQADQPEPSVILSESVAKRLWPGQNPIGRTLRLRPDGADRARNATLPDEPTYQVIGIARDTRELNFDHSVSEQAYLQLPRDHLAEYPILIRTLADPKASLAAISPLISSIDPDLVATSSTFEEMLRQTPVFFASSFSALIATIVGLLGLLLASMGIYGTVSYVVVLRTREVGVRIALGANKRDILKIMLRSSMSPVLAGLLAGMGIAIVASTLMRGVLHGLSAADGLSVTGVSGIFLSIALLAAYLPSRRAMSVDPVVALRYE